jgi:hypothetical protein
MVWFSDGKRSFRPQNQTVIPSSENGSITRDVATTGA